MKSFRKAFLGNREYHSNLLGQEFDGLVEDATDKGLTRPDSEANEQVILAINDPNTGMELTPQKISQELRKHLRSTNPQKQWLAMVLIRDVITRCRTNVEPVLMELLAAVSVIATMNTSTSGQALRNAKEVAVEVLNQFGRRGNREQRISAPTAQHHTRARSEPPSSTKREPEKSLQYIKTYEQSCKNHCDVVCGLIKSGEAQELTSGLIGELMSEIKHMRKILVRAVEVLSEHNGPEVEAAIAKGFEAIDATNKLFELHKKAVSGEMGELTLRDMAFGRRESSRSLDFIGEQTIEEEKPALRQRSRSVDLIVLDDLEDGLHQPPPQQPETDPFQVLANTPRDASTSQPQQNLNPFGDSAFSF